MLVRYNRVLIGILLISKDLRWRTRQVPGGGRGKDANAIAFAPGSRFVRILYISAMEVRDTAVTASTTARGRRPRSTRAVTQSWKEVPNKDLSQEKREVFRKLLGRYVHAASIINAVCTGKETFPTGITPQHTYNDVEVMVTVLKDFCAINRVTERFADNLIFQVKSLKWVLRK